MKKTNNSGFSLVELIIVIAIMAVLIGVLAPQFVKYVEKSKESKDITNLDSCVSVVQSYYADKDWPSGGVTITAAKGSVLASTNGQAALDDAGANSSKVTGDWTTNISATVTSDGKVTYAGEAKYYTVVNNEFKAKDGSGASSAASASN